MDDFQRVDRPEEEIGTVEVNQKEQYELIRRKGVEMLVAKKRTEGVEYKKVLVQTDGGLVVAAESTQVQ